MTEDKNKYILSINGMSKSFGRNKVLKGIISDTPLCFINLLVINLLLFKK